MKEVDIRRQVKEYLQWRLYYVYYNIQGLGSFPGLSDLVAIKDGRVVHLEIKTTTGRQSEKQKEFQADLEEAGGEYRIVRGIDDVQDL